MAGTSFISKSTLERPPRASDHHVMILLVDDQAMVCEAVRRVVANEPDIDFHYCADAREALSLAPLGPAAHPDTQMEVIREGLGLLATATGPGGIVESSVEWPE